MKYSTLITLLLNFFHFLRNVYSRKYQTTQDCLSSGMGFFVLLTGTTAARDGISPSTVQSAQLQQPLMVWSTCYRETVTKKICSVCGKLKESVKKSKRALCAWGSGLVIDANTGWNSVSPIYVEEIPPPQA